MHFAAGRNENAGDAVILWRISQGILPLAAVRRRQAPAVNLPGASSPARAVLLPRHADVKDEELQAGTACSISCYSKTKGADMPQYFFNLTNGETVRDEQGTRCDTVEDVKTYALAVAAELGRNRSPEELDTLALCVIDETGQEVFRTKVVNMQTAPNAEAMTRAARNEES